MVAYNCNLNTWESEAGGSRVPGQLVFIVKFYPRQTTTKQNTSPEWRSLNIVFGKLLMVSGAQVVLKEIQVMSYCWLRLESLQDSPPPGRLSYGFIKVLGHMDLEYSEKQG